MVRRTKEDALETRASILDTAEHVFREKGVSKTSLADIAQAAGVTRGAIYWHFKNKADLFEAMCDRVAMPLEVLLAGVADVQLDDPLGKLREVTVEIMRQAETDERRRRVFDILSFKCEFVDELATVMGRRLECRRNGIGIIEQNFRIAIQRGQLPETLDIRRAAIGFFAFVDGLIYNWGLAAGSYSLADEAGAFVDLFLNGLRKG